MRMYPAWQSRIPGTPNVRFTANLFSTLGELNDKLFLPPDLQTPRHNHNFPNRRLNHLA